MSESTSIAIVGAGFAGLNAAYHLEKAGYQPILFEADSEIGGRVRSRKGLLHQDLTTELGAEFIDEDHTDMLHLVKEFGLETIERNTWSSKKSARRHYFSEGVEHSSEEILEAAAPFLEQIQNDCDRLAAGDFTTFDQMTAAEYLDQFDMPSWLRTIWDVAVTGMYGLEPEKQTAVNLLWLRPQIKDGEFLPFGDPGQTRTVLGGNNLVAQKLADHLTNPVRLNKKLMALKQHPDKSIELSFADGETRAFDWVIIAIPFSVLRYIELDIDLPDTLQRFINELDYGMNAKFMVGFEEAIWRDMGSSGSVASDHGPFATWDNSENQGQQAAGMTFYLGGDIGVELGNMSIEEAYDYFMEGYEQILPGAGTCSTEEASKGTHWPSYELARGSYACYGVKQWDAFIKHHVYSEEMGLTDAVGVERLLFTGEHLSADFQGYMNGAAQTGRLVAQALIKKLG